MEYKKILDERYSVRKFTEEKISEELLNEILEAGRTAPSAHNHQPTVVLVLNEDQINMLREKEITRYTFHAKNMLLICYDKKISSKKESDGFEFGVVDAAIATTMMTLRITDLKMGSCMVGAFDPLPVSEMMNLDDTLVPFLLLPFGYPREDSAPIPLHYDRKPMEEFRVQ